MTNASVDFTTHRPVGNLLAGIVRKAATASAADQRKRVKSGALHRTGAPVLRSSLEAGTFEDTFYMIPAKGETDTLLRTARKLLDIGRHLKSEERAGKKLSRFERTVALITPAAVRVYEVICTLARLNGGKVFPSYDHLMEASTYRRGAVASALNALEQVGLLIRQRRFKRVEAEGPGPRYKQTSNVYRLTLARRVIACLPRWMRPGPVPDDEMQRQVDRQEDHEHMLTKLSGRELAHALPFQSAALAAAFASLGDRFDEPECES